ncbi:DoxX family protein [Flavobacterium sp. J27]|uniref:DoxX family protein n=1 Tax=Flavobacterium sp. J27 TaxID=2060419 RepID=UPI001031C02D|nr:DoxX family protein [Flavobacterium sp. J27]
MHTYLKFLYWIFTVLFSLLMIYSSVMYLSKYEIIKSYFEKLGYPNYLIYPLAVLKITGVVVILTNWKKTLKEWAYAAFFFEILLAFFAHYMIKDGGQNMALFAFLFLLISYFLGKKVRS